MGALEGKVVVFTGTFAGYTRDQIQALAQRHGAQTPSMVSGGVDFLVTGDDAGLHKRHKAETLGIDVLDVVGFMALLEGRRLPLGLEARLEPAQLVAALEALAWSRFEPQRDGFALRDVLTRHAALYGVGPAHHLASARLRDMLELLNPFAHEGRIIASAASPDGRWLATGSGAWWDYDRGGLLQIWELATGHVVNQIRLCGGVAGEVAWSPDSRLIAAAFDTDGLGVWQPFEDDHTPMVYAYMTEAAPRFAWRPDASALWVEAERGRGGDASHGWWLPVDEASRGHVLDRASLGVSTERPATQDPVGPLRAQVEPYRLRFLEHLDGSGRGDYIFDPACPPTQAAWRDEGLRMTFPVEGASAPGVVIAEGAVVAPRDYLPATHLSLSLGRRVSWPIAWAPWIVVAPTVDALMALADDEISEALSERRAAA